MQLMEAMISNQPPVDILLTDMSKRIREKCKRMERQKQQEYQQQEERKLEEGEEEEQTHNDEDDDDEEEELD